jgi:hypothetical protein
MQWEQVVGFSSSGGLASVDFYVAAIAAIALIGAWVILASSRFVQGGVVERPERVPQLYGYTVCLISLMWALASVSGIVENMMTLSAPEYHQGNDYGMQPSITSFENFRLTYDRARRFGAGDPGTAKLDTLPEAELQRRFTAYRTDRIAAIRVEARQSMISRIVSLLLALGLFVFHWRWLKRRASMPSAGV